MKRLRATIARLPAFWTLVSSPTRSPQLSARALSDSGRGEDTVLDAS